MVQLICCNDGKNRVSKKLQALVVLRSGAAVRQRALEQRRIGEGKPESLLQCRQTRIDHRGGVPEAGQLDRPSPEYLISR